MSAQVVDAGGVIRVLTTIRAHALLFSLPYVWVWTAGLSTLTRWSAVAVHGCALLAANMWNDVADAKRGVPPHVGLSRNPDLVDVALARKLAWSLATAAIVVSFGLTEVSALAPAAVFLALVAVWSVARVPTDRKYLSVVELAAPLFVVVAPAVALAVTTDVTMDPSTVVAGAAFLAALVLAAHVRDRDRDLAHRIPTVATRNLYAARGWLLLAALVGSIAACVSVAVPLDGGDIMRVAGAVSFGAAAVVQRGHVPVMTIAHGVFAVSLLFSP